MFYKLQKYYLLLLFFSISIFISGCYKCDRVMKDSPIVSNGKADVWINLMPGGEAKIYYSAEFELNVPKDFDESKMKVEELIIQQNDFYLETKFRYEFLSKDQNKIKFLVNSDGGIDPKNFQIEKNVKLKMKMKIDKHLIESTIDNLKIEKVF